MIIDRLENLKLYSMVHEDLPKLIEALEALDIEAAESGRYEIPGCESFYIVQKYLSRGLEESIWEAHRKFLDVQIVFSGQEYIGYSNIKYLTVDTPYDEKGDAALFTGRGAMLQLRQNEFMLLLPEDGHMPCVMIDEPEQIIKVVAKLPV